MLGDPGLLGDRRQQLTSPGMADWVDLSVVRYCVTCIHLQRKHCTLFRQLMQRAGPELPAHQRACRKYQQKPKEK